MNTTTKVQLDWKKLLGFNLAADARSNGLTAATLVKLGSKVGTKTGTKTR
jgi:hypothetical protein